MATTEEIGALQLRIEASTRRFEDQLRRANQRLQRSSRDMERRAEKLNRRLSEVGSSFGLPITSRAVAVAAAVATIGSGIRSVVRNGDDLRRLEGRFTALTGSSERAARKIEDIFKIARETGASLDTVAQSMTRFTLASEQLGATDAQVARLVETVLKLGAIGGGSTQQLEAGAVQLGQALASGRLQGDELRSVLENIPLVARRIAVGLGVAQGQLRQMAADGELTADRVFGALLQGASDVDREFSALPTTVGLAANKLTTAWAAFTREIDNSTGASRTLAGVLEGAAETLEGIANSDAFSRLTLTGGGRPPLRDPQEAREAIAAANQSETAEARRENLRRRRRGQSPRRVPRGAGDVSPPLPEILENAQGFDEVEAGRRDLERRSRQLGEEEARRLREGATRRSLPGLLDTGSQNAPQFAFVLPRVRPPTDSIPLPDTPVSGGGGPSDAERQEEAIIRTLEAQREQVELATQELALVGKTGVERARMVGQFERQRAISEAQRQAQEAGRELTAEELATVTALAEQQERVTVAIALAHRQDEERLRTLRAQQQAIQAFSAGIADAIANAEDLQDAFRKIAARIGDIAIQGAFSQGPAGGFVNQALGTTAGGVLGALFSAKGNAFTNGRRITAFARGGVVDGPTAFPMARGIGIMGEAGPEAILPLKRGRGGKLGVAAEGGGGGVTLIAPISVDARGAVAGIGAEVGRQVTQALNKQLPAISASLQQRGRRS